MKKTYSLLIAICTTCFMFAQNDFFTVSELMTEYNNLNLSSGQTASERYTVRGYVTKWKDGYPDYQNGTFYIDDSATGSTTLLQCFRLKGVENYDKVTLVVGDYVEVQNAQLMNYYGSAELKNGSFTIISKPSISGQCGDNINYNFDNNILTFTGVGDMWEDSETMLELNDYKPFIHSIIFQEGITSIKSSAFSDCINLHSIALPSSLESINHNAFKGSGLQSVTIPNNVTFIGEEAFAECMNLTSATLGGSLQFLSNGVFSNCRNLSSIFLPYSLTYLAPEVIHGTNIYYDDTKWENGALYINDCLISGIRRNPDDISILEELGFATIPEEISTDSVYSIKEGTRLIAADAFRPDGETNWIKKLIIPHSVKYIGSYALMQNTLTELEWNATHCFDFEIPVPFTDGQTTDNPFYITPFENESIPYQYKHAYVQKISFAQDVEYLPKDLCRRMPNLREIYNYNPNPIIVSPNMFEMVDYHSCVLYVPQGSVFNYAAAPVWENFINIQEMPNVFTNTENRYINTIPVKIFRNGQLFILRDGRTYTIHGQEVK